MDDLEQLYTLEMYSTSTPFPYFFTALPAELFLEILEHLDVQTIRHLRGVSHWFNRQLSYRCAQQYNPHAQVNLTPGHSLGFLLACQSGFTPTHPTINAPVYLINHKSCQAAESRRDNIGSSDDEEHREVSSDSEGALRLALQVMGNVELNITVAVAISKRLGSGKFRRLRHAKSFIGNKHFRRCCSIAFSRAHKTTMQALAGSDIQVTGLQLQTGTTRNILPSCDILNGTYSNFHHIKNYSLKLYCTVCTTCLCLNQERDGAIVGGNKSIHCWAKIPQVPNPPTTEKYNDMSKTLPLETLHLDFRPHHTEHNHDTFSNSEYCGCDSANDRNNLATAILTQPFTHLHSLSLDMIELSNHTILISVIKNNSIHNLSLKRIILAQIDMWTPVMQAIEQHSTLQTLHLRYICCSNSAVVFGPERRYRLDEGRSRSHGPYGQIAWSVLHNTTGHAVRAWKG